MEWAEYCGVNTYQGMHHFIEQVLKIYNNKIKIIKRGKEKLYKIKESEYNGKTPKF